MIQVLARDVAAIWCGLTGAGTEIAYILTALFVSPYSAICLINDGLKYICIYGCLCMGLKRNIISCCTHTWIVTVIYSYMYYIIRNIHWLFVKFHLHICWNACIIRFIAVSKLQCKWYWCFVHLDIRIHMAIIDQSHFMFDQFRFG